MNEKELVTTLAAKVGEQGTVIESAITLIEGLVAAVKATGGDVSPELLALLDQVAAQSMALSTAVVANTPGSTLPPVAP